MLIKEQEELFILQITEYVSIKIKLKENQSLNRKVNQNNRKEYTANLFWNRLYEFGIIVFWIVNFFTHPHNRQIRK